MTNESEHRKASKRRKNSPSMEVGEISSGGGPLKKGPWTSAEDAILLDYVKKHGEGNWNAVQKNSGLSRCGKSCRLRWANHLRPDLRKGAFTPEEENRIIELHAQMGNKWARMANELTGRTDNEIKNFWNTRIKRLQRAGLPPYPPEIRAQALNENQQSEDTATCMKGGIDQSDSSLTSGFGGPDVKSQYLKLIPEFLHTSSPLLAITTSGLIQKTVSISHSYDFRLPQTDSHRWFHRMEAQFHGSAPSTSSVFPSFDQYEDDALVSMQSHWLPSSCDHDLELYQSLPIGGVHGSHALMNGNSSSSEPLYEAVKVELPSLQLPAGSQAGSWATTYSPLPSPDSVDVLIQSPLSEHIQSNNPSPPNSGLLDTILHESKFWKGLKNDSYQLMSEASAIAGGGIETSSQIVDGNPISPLSQSAVSVFAEHTPFSGGSSSDEPQSIETLPGFQIKPEAIDLSTELDERKDVSCQSEYLRPDALLDSCWFGTQIGFGDDQTITADAGALINDNLNNEDKQVDGLPSESWDNVSAIYQFSNKV